MEADALILFGFILSAQDVSKFDENEDGLPDWEAIYAKKVGILRPEVSFEDNYQLFQQYWTDKREAVKKSGVGVQSTGWMEDPTFVVFTYFQSAYHGDVKQITAPIATRPGVDKLKEWCEVMGVEFQNPQWLLANLLSP